MTEAAHAGQIVQVSLLVLASEGLAAHEVPQVPDLEHAVAVCCDELVGVLDALAADEAAGVSF